VCFPASEEQVEFEEDLARVGVQVEQFEHDDFHKIVFEGEHISESNQIESLF